VIELVPMRWATQRHSSLAEASNKMRPERTFRSAPARCSVRLGDTAESAVRAFVRRLDLSLVIFTATPIALPFGGSLFTVECSSTLLRPGVLGLRRVVRHGYSVSETAAIRRS
jgi:hypothetical protein